MQQSEEVFCDIDLFSVCFYFVEGADVEHLRICLLPHSEELLHFQNHSKYLRNLLATEFGPLYQYPICLLQCLNQRVVLNMK